jgi:isoquinoline 1-oxidoreductase beta subunit
MTTLSRREFLKVSAAVGGGLALEISFPAASLGANAQPATEVNAWVVIHPDDRVVIRIARSEMGQGSFTALAQLVAEELDCEWSKVSAEFASPNEHFRRNRIWGSMSTGGSQGIRSSQDYLRKAGATAREMLVAAAAAQWKVAPEACSASAGTIVHGATGRKLRYGQVASAAAKLSPPGDVKLRDPSAWKIAGQPVHRLDIPDKVRGKPVFGVDVALPGMLHASIAQCPVFGGKVKDVDASAAMAMRGVKKVVREEDFVAVVADNWWRANQALKQVKIDWDTGASGRIDNQAIATMLRDGLDAANLPQARKMGDAPAALASAAKVIEAEYQSPYLNHATMEPQTCTAWLKPEGFLDVWTSTQAADASMMTAAEVSGLPLEKIEVHKMMLGGGFGRRGAPQDFVRQGVAIAKRMPGVPVKLMWSREEDMQHGYYRPTSLVRIKAGVDAQGKLTAMHTTIACPSIYAVFAGRNARMRGGIDGPAVRTFSDMPYLVPNQQVDYAQRNGHVPVGYWRAPGQQNAYYRESFIDELAVAAGKDPVEYRLAMLDAGDKNRRVLEAVAKAANWSAPLPKGLYRGVAVADGFGSYTALVAELTLNPAGEVRVKRVVIAIDSGYVVNPDTCRAQAESNVVYGLGAVLYQENNVRDGRIVESNFHDFKLPHIDEIPQVETVLVPSGGFWGGHGEPAILALAPAICNAIFAATGKRIRSLPLTHHDLTPI